MQADMRTLHKNLTARHVMYQYNHNKPMSLPAAAQLLSNTLYYKRFFPYYTFNLVAGLDPEGADQLLSIVNTQKPTQRPLRVQGGGGGYVFWVHK